MQTSAAVRWTTRGLAAYALLGGGTALLGWLAHLPRLTDWRGTDIVMFPNTAFAAVCCGAALLLALAGRRWSLSLAGILGVVVLLLGGATLLEHLLSVNLGIDTLLAYPSWGAKAAVAVGRMGPPASTSFTLLGLSLVLIATGRRAGRRIVPLLGMLVCAIAALGFMGHIVGADELFAVARWTGVAMETASILLVLGLAVIASVPECQPMRTLLSRGAAGVLLRRSLPFILLLPPALGWACVRGQEAGWFDAAMGTSLLTLTLVGIFCGLLSWWARAVGMHERRIERLNGELKQKLDEMQTLQELLPVGVWIGNQDCSDIRGNTEAYRLFGLPLNTNVSLTAKKRLLPIGLRMRVNGAEVPPDDLPMQAVARTGKPWNNIEQDLVFADGTTKVVYGSVAPLFDEKGAVRQVIAAYADFTDRKRAEEERQRLLESEQAARRQAEEAGRLKDEFLATLSHELRTPLNAILGWSRLIDLHPEHVGTVKEGLEVIVRNAKMQADLIADLLDMSRIISGKLRLEMEDVDLAGVVRAAIDTLRPSAVAKGIQIDTGFALAGETVRGDPRRLQQVVWNLLSNAIKFTPAGGRVGVVLAREGTQAAIEVSDTGVGIPLEFLPHVFERFRQADGSSTRRHGGLGLGLALVKNLVELHAGTVRAESAGEGQGATFVVYLPLALPRPVGDTARGDGITDGRAVTAGTALEGLRVLVIDDQMDAREVVGRVLRECRAEVALAGSCDEGLEVLKAFSPQVILCDIGMPGKDGHAFIREARQRGHDMPALAVTAFVRPEDRALALGAGYAGHIAKPVEPAELVAAVAAVARR